MAGHFVEEPATTHIRKQGNRDLGHTDAGPLAHHPMTAAGQNAKTPSHHDTMTPADNGFGVGMKNVIHPVFPGEKVLGVITGPAWIFQT